jgi:hypothetical protein
MENLSHGPTVERGRFKLGSEDRLPNRFVDLAWILWHETLHHLSVTNRPMAIDYGCDNDDTLKPEALEKFTKVGLD